MCHFRFRTFSDLNCFSDVQPPPRKPKLILNGEAKNKWSILGGTYTLQSTPVNGNPWWKKGMFDKEALWFDEIAGNWLFGYDKDLGTNIGGVEGPFGIDQWPNNISSGWQYASNEWHEAGNDIIIEGEQNNFISASRQTHQVKFSIHFSGSESFTKKMMGVFKSKQ